MDQPIIIQLVSFFVTAGFLYGSFNSRVKSLEREINDQKDIKERLARIEEQTKLLLEYFIKK
jgi:hypothetical protein